jgi:hypothetical protein
MLLACVAMLFAVQPAVASDDEVAAELAEMRELMTGLQQKVEAQEEQLEHQSELLDQAQSVVRERTEEGSKSGLSPFLDAISVGGHVAGSYLYNFDNPQGTYGGSGINNGGFPGGGLVGDNALGTYPFHGDHNSFTVDQIWFSISKPATEESRGGFAFDLLYGNTANFLGQGTGTDRLLIESNGRLVNSLEFEESGGRRVTSIDSTSDYYIAQAYVEYACDCGTEVDFLFGKRQTLVGAEVVQAPANFNITRGNVYTFTQPVDHLGFWGTAKLGDMAEFTVGIMNEGGSEISSPDLNKEKSYEASMHAGDDKMNIRTTFIYGADVTPFGVGEFLNVLDNPNSTRTGLIDTTAWFNPTDEISTWVNHTYTYIEGSRVSLHGVALAGRVQLTEVIGAAIRGEYLKATTDANANVGGVSLFDDGFELYSLTGTVDVALTDHLMARGEVRFDAIQNLDSSGVGFFENSDGNSDNQTVGAVEVIYTF